MEDGIVISRIPITDKRYQQVYDLREEVLRKPIGLSLKNEDLTSDAINTIFIAEKDNKVIGCVMLYPIDDEEKIKLRQMAVDGDWQGRGVGRMLVEAAETYAKQQGYSSIILHARSVSEGFYKKLGYYTTSSEFTEVGIPHVVMEKDIF
ncbi:MAG: GNAT family N-acetyltransferase [Bacteroidetes bacterium]|uniref:GNAT family N-acetyltransferase n=1 Tax=uncultured Dysgonomonas sp. TaxID=206096 RepID=UPI001AD3D706|nr:GNAT family N-acetyltransferase [uncultured Dysgonomonas sp.]MBN9483085.1 GNAT family N-acetyltransferase [Bacteroidota bacterium]